MGLWGLGFGAWGSGLGVSGLGVCGLWVEGLGMRRLSMPRKLDFSPVFHSFRVQERPAAGAFSVLRYPKP